MTNLVTLQVFLHDQLIGTLTYLSGDKNLFTLESSYIEDPHRPTLSLSFKDNFGDLITNIKQTRRRVPTFFANLLPEGPMRDYLASRANINPQHEFFLLRTLGRDLPGAIRIHSTDSEKEQPKDKEDPLRFSLAGVQLKFSAIKNVGEGCFTIPVDGSGGSWIVKLPSSNYQNVPENEYTMMELARNMGIDVPETFLMPIKEIGGLPDDMEKIGPCAFIIKRFDRSSSGELVHIEDFAQVIGAYPEDKYKKASYRNIAEIILAEIGEEGIREFIRRFVFNALIGNGDMHLKNWSLIYLDQRKAALAPAYDFVSTIPYLPQDKLALNFVDSKEFTSLNLNQFERFAIKANLPTQLILDTVQETVQAFAESWKTIRDYPLNSEFRNMIASHLKTIPIWTKYSKP